VLIDDSSSVSGSCGSCAIETIQHSFGNAREISPVKIEHDAIYNDMPDLLNITLTSLDSSPSYTKSNRTMLSETSFNSHHPDLESVEKDLAEPPDGSDSCIKGTPKSSRKCALNSLEENVEVQDSTSVSNDSTRDFDKCCSSEYHNLNDTYLDPNSSLINSAESISNVTSSVERDAVNSIDFFMHVTTRAQDSITVFSNSKQNADVCNSNSYRYYSNNEWIHTMYKPVQENPFSELSNLTDQEELDMISRFLAYRRKDRLLRKQMRYVYLNVFIRFLFIFQIYASVVCAGFHKRIFRLTDKRTDRFSYMGNKNIQN